MWTGGSEKRARAKRPKRGPSVTWFRYLLVLDLLVLDLPSLRTVMSARNDREQVPMETTGGNVLEHKHSALVSRGCGSTICSSSVYSDALK